MAINLSATRAELENQITRYLIDNNPNCFNSWLPTLFVFKKKHTVANDLCKIVKSVTNLPCQYEFGNNKHVDASYYEVIKLKIPKMFFDGYLNGNVSNNWLPGMVGPIVDISLHELVHYEQVLAGFKDPSAKKKKIPAHWVGPKAYFSFQREIEAWAIYVASELSRKMPKKEIFHLLSTRAGTQFLCDRSIMFEKYFTLFFKGEIKVWRTFVRKIVHHINTF